MRTLDFTAKDKAKAGAKTKAFESSAKAEAKTKVFEYENATQLDKSKSAYFVIPASIILNKESNDKRCTVFSYMSVRRGLDGNILYTVNDLAEWTNRTPNRHKNGINTRFIEAIEELSIGGYIDTFCKPNHTSLSKAYLNMDKISDECKEYRFATIYIDELNKILNYENMNSKDGFFNADIVLLVFSYLRMMITRRKNKLMPEDYGDSDKRKEKFPDVYDCYQIDIADKLGISQKSASKAIDALKEIGLIYHEELPRVQVNGEWHTSSTLFCNFEKREGKMLLAEGRKYYMEEIKNKKKKLLKLAG